MKQNIRLLQQELQRFPFVEASATSMSIPIGYSGNPVTDDNGNVLFSTRFEIADDNYIPTMEMTFVKGGNFTGSKQVIVTEEFVKKTGWKDNLVEKEVKSGAEETYGTVVGILKNYASEPLLMGNGYEPVLIVRQEYVSTYLMLRLTKITSENLEAINDKLSDNENPFSGGQQQRVAIARAVVANPKLILADEPTGNLDSKNGLEVMTLLGELNREGATIVMVTHSQHDASFSHRIINLFDGEIVTEVQSKM